VEVRVYPECQFYLLWFFALPF